MNVLISVRPNSPWYNEDVREAKRDKRRAERRLSRNENSINREIYHEKCRLYNDIISDSKSSYLREEIEKLDNKGLFQWMQKLTSPPSYERSLPSHESDKQLANDFGSFFQNKILKIVDELDGRQTVNEAMQQETIHPTFSKFHPISEDDDVLNVIKESPSKSCRLDHAPTWLIKKCIDVLISFFTKLVNLLVSSGIVPSLFKTSHVISILKKPKLHVENMANCQPIANLMFLSKS